MQLRLRDLALGLGPVRYFRLDDAGRAAAIDETGRANGAYNGTTLQKGVPGLAAGDPNRACRFNPAGSDYVGGATASDLQGAVNFTVWAIIRPNTLSSYQTIAGLLAAADLGWWLQTDATGAVLFWTSRDGATQNVAKTADGVITVGRERVVMAQYDGTTASVYVDNVLSATFNWGSSAPLHTVAAANAFAVGRSGAFNADYFDGVIDELMIFQALVTPTQPFSAAVRARLYSAARGRASFDLPLPAVRWRQSRPPHGVLFETEYSDLRYGYQLGAGQTGTFLLPRGDPAIAWVRDELTRGDVPMVTVERDDRALPFVGFVMQIPRADDADPYIGITVRDHWARLAAARTSVSGTVSGASGVLIANAVKEAAARAQPPLFLNLALLPQVSPAASFDLRANKLDQFLRALETQTGWEVWFAYDIDERHVTTYLAWTARRGFDRRNGQVLLQGRQLAGFSYPLDFEAGSAVAVAVGGSGAFSGRPAVSAAAGAAGTPLKGFQQALGGTAVAISQQVTDKRVLAQRAAYLLTTPENAVARISAKLLEAETDMRSIEVGDIRTVRTADGFLGAPTEQVARIVAMQINPAEGVHDIECVEWGA